MSKLEIFSETGRKLRELTDGDEIAAALDEISVIFERWPTRELAPDADSDTILASYAPEIERLQTKGGYRSIDAISVAPDHPDRAAMRTKFLSEHSHAEDEVRFFVRGEGLFTLHAADRVWSMLCREGDLISVPANMTHWFDMGAAPNFTAIRMFVNPDGWVAAFTGSDIAERFPRYKQPDVIKVILTDIEGTTSSLAFVSETLFPYARARLPAYVAEHGGDLAQLLAWIDADAKITELKAIQGDIWRGGYAAGELRGHVYPDAADALRRWHAEELVLAVFSSGSVAAQKLIFQHSDQGDLAPLFSGWFDTTTGSKREAMSYVLIADALGVSPANTLFLSDVVAETDAAKAAGMKALVIDREQGRGDIASFADIKL